MIEQFEQDGLVVVPEVLAPETVATLRVELERAMKQDLEQQGDVFDRGMVHNCMFRGREMARLLDNPSLNDTIKRLLSPSCILYAYQSSSAPPSGSNYGQRIHVDSPRYIPGYVTNIGVIFALDDFTPQNGATRYLPGSHLRRELPSESKFNKQCLMAECNAGDMIVFHARLAHATGFNATRHHRHALTMNFCRCFMRQRFDFCRMPEASESFLETLGPDARRLLGLDVRMPTSLEEFYLPEEERLYKPGQE